MPEYSSTTITPSDGVQVPSMNGSTSGNFLLSALKSYILSEKGLANGLASLDGNGKLTASQLPDLADDVIVVASYSTLPATGTAGKLYITADNNKMYRWDPDLTTPDYVELSVDLSAYATKAELAAEESARESADSNLLSAIESNSQRIENLEVAVSGSLVQTNTDSTMANTKTITNANSILPWAILKRVGARATQFNQLVTRDLPTLKTYNTSGTWNDNAYTSGGITFTVNSDNITVTGSGTANFTVAIKPMDVVHKTLLCGCPSGGTQITYQLQWSNNVDTAFRDVGDGVIHDSFTNNGNSITIRITNGSNVNLVFRPNLFDLTAMGEYDSALTDAQNIAKFRSKYPASYYPPNAGEIIPLNPSGFKVVGKQKWDEQWRLGYYASTTGAFVSNDSNIANVNPIRVLPSTGYYMTVNYNFNVYFYDAEGNFLSWVTATTKTFVTPSDCFYVNFRIVADYGSTYNHDLMICLNSVTDKTYEEYKETTIDTSFLSGKKYVNPDCYDYSENVYKDGVLRRKDQTVVGYVDLGDLEWSQYTGSTFWHATLNNPKMPPNPNTVANILCDKLNVTTSYNVNTQAVDNSVAIHSISDLIWVYCSAYESVTADAFKTAMTGIKVYYELATLPDPTYGDPIPNIPCEDGTTVTAVTPQTDLVNAIDVPSTIAYMTKISS